MRESEVEAYLVKRVKALGGEALNFRSEGRPDVPNLLVLLPPPKRPVTFVTVKATGRKPNKRQVEEHDRLRAAGAFVCWLSTKAEVDKWLGYEH